MMLRAGVPRAAARVLTNRQVVARTLIGRSGAQPPLTVPEMDPVIASMDYPEASRVNRQWRDPTAKYDDPQERVNLDEIVRRRVLRGD